MSDAKPLAGADGSDRLDSMKNKDRARGRLWCSLCKTYGSHYSNECPVPPWGEPPSTGSANEDQQ